MPASNPSLVIGVGGGLLNTPLATTVTTGVPADQGGAASGLMNTGKQFGGALALAAASAVAVASGSDRGAFVLMAGLVAAAALVAARIPAHRSGNLSAETAARTGVQCSLRRAPLTRDIWGDRECPSGR